MLATGSVTGSDDTLSGRRIPSCTLSRFAGCYLFFFRHHERTMWSVLPSLVAVPAGLSAFSTCSFCSPVEFPFSLSSLNGSMRCFEMSYSMHGPPPPPSSSPLPLLHTHYHLSIDATYDRGSDGQRDVMCVWIESNVGGCV